MTKNLTLLILSLLFFQAAKAQQDNPPGTIIYFRDKSGQPTDKEHVNDVIFIYPSELTYASDSSSGKKLYPIKEFYIDGTVKLTGTAITQSSIPIFEGPSIKYYPNGQKESVGNYKDGYLTGDIAFFYPNGKFNSIENYDNDKMYLITCKDSLGNVLAEKGNGKWTQIEYIDNNKVVSEGAVKDSLQEGEWHQAVNDSIKYVTIYKKGLAVSSTNPSQQIGEKIFVEVEKSPEFPHGGAAGFVSYLEKYVRYPSEDRRNRVLGKVRITFIVEKDGSLADVKAINAPSETIAAELIRVVSSSPHWIPGMQNGLAVRVRYSILFSFDLSR